MVERATRPLDGRGGGWLLADRNHRFLGARRESSQEARNQCNAKEVHIRIAEVRITILLGSLLVLLAGCPALDREAPEPDLGPPNATALPTGQQITPTLPPAASFASLNPGLAKYPDLAVGGAVTEALSPDGATLAILTTGYNRWNDPESGKRNPDLQSEYVFLFDVSAGKPVQKQVLALPNTWAGITFSPDGKALYVSGGVDDSIHTFRHDGDRWVGSPAPIALKHAAGVGTEVKPVAAGLPVTADRKTTTVAHTSNHFIFILGIRTREVAAEIDLRPGKNGGRNRRA